MSKYCIECGKELNGAKFCPECGAAAEGIQTNKVHGKSVIGYQGFDVRYLAIVVIAIVYLLLMFSTWIEMSIPSFLGNLGDFEFKVYELFFGIIEIFIFEEVVEIRAVVGLLVILSFSLVLLVLSIWIGFLSIVTVLKVMRNDYNAANDISRASCIAIFMSVLVILTMFILKSTLRSALDGELGYIGGQIFDDVVSLTKAPIILLITGIIGKYTGDKLIYLFWKDEH